MEDEIEQFLEQHETCYDRFTFDKIMRFLLANDYSHEDAKDTILFNCSLSMIIFEERIYNGYYEKISLNETISEDLLVLKNETVNRILKNQIEIQLNKQK
jgi:hypothetical protein